MEGKYNPLDPGLDSMKLIHYAYLLIRSPQQPYELITIIIPPLQMGKTEAQRDCFPRRHSEQVAEPEFVPRKIYFGVPYITIMLCLVSSNTWWETHGSDPHSPASQTLTFIPPQTLHF